MNLLLDTHLLVWVMLDADALSAGAREHIAAAETVYASAASLWELSIKASLGKLTFNTEILPTRLREAGFRPLHVTWEHARAVKALPPIHRDPFDRMLVAQAMVEPLRLLTADRILAEYSDLVTVV